MIRSTLRYGVAVAAIFLSHAAAADILEPRPGGTAASVSTLASSITSGAKATLADEFKRNIDEYQRSLRTAPLESSDAIKADLAAHKIAFDALTGSITATTPTSASKEIMQAEELIAAKVQPVSTNENSIVETLPPDAKIKILSAISEITSNLQKRKETTERVIKTLPEDNRQAFVARIQEIDSSLTAMADVQSLVAYASTESQPRRSLPGIEQRRFRQETLMSLSRPMFPVCGGDIWPRDGQDLEGWAPRIRQFLKDFPEVSRATGLVSMQIYNQESNALEDSAKVGTGFVVGPDLILTNHHVVKKFAYEGFDITTRENRWLFYDLVGATFSTGFEDQRCQPAATPTEIFEVEEVVTASAEDGADYALLRIKGGNLPTPLKLSDEIAINGEDVVVLGFPAEPGSDDVGSIQETLEEIRKQMLMTPDGRIPSTIKRISPGRVTNDFTTVNTIPFNYNSFGGNSGSPVIRIRDGVVVALHHSGKPHDDFISGYNRGMPLRDIIPIVTSALSESASR